MSDHIKREYDEWCTDCKEYDKERHCCPRWNKVIRDTMDEIRQNADVRENVKSEWELTDHAYTVYCKKCGYKHNRASQYCPECGAYMTNGTKWFGTDDER